MDELSGTQLAAISRLFSSVVIGQLARRGRSPLFASLVFQSGLAEFLAPQSRVSNVFDAAFDLLSREGNRDEYVYKTALTQKILFGRHSMQTASLLAEFRVGTCKADLAILNGTATVYEIKSERDSLSRLERQVNAYASVFAAVNVVASENHIPAILSLVPEEIGILQLNRRFRLSTVRESVSRPEETSPTAIFDSIRLNEACAILRQVNIEVPKVPNTVLSSTLRALFKSLDPLTTHRAMVSVLKKSRTHTPLSELVQNLPRALQTAALTVPIRKLDHSRLLQTMKTPFREALKWN